MIHYLEDTLPPITTIRRNIAIITTTTTTIPVVIGALELVKKGTENYTSKTPGNIRIAKLQKIVLLGTAHILRRTLSIK